MEKLFFAQCIDKTELKNSSSGGVFWQLVKYVIKNNGVVFGASWNKNWLVDITYAESLNDCKKFMTSKYLLANIGNSYRDCKKFLEKGRLVLYSGISCQTAGLLNFLQKKYDNLILLDVECHGLPSIQMWMDYLEKIKKSRNPILNINFRSKIGGWSDYCFEVRYKHGKALIESHRKNKYMRQFLCDHYLRECCYNCKYKNKYSSADLIIGDFWTIKNVCPNLFSDDGCSFVIVKSKTGEDILNKINKYLTVKEIKHNGNPYSCVGIRDKTHVKRIKYNKDIFERRIAIINNSFQSNMGGVIQTYALQQTLKKLGYKSFAYNANLNWSKYYLKFIDEHINVKYIGEYEKAGEIPYSKHINKEDVSGFIIGSDQIWRKDWNDIDNVFLEFAKHWKVNKIIYGASMGTEEWNYSDEDNKRIKKLIKQFSGVSVREVDLIYKAKKYLGVEPKLVLDPAFLLNKKEYESLCSNIEHRDGIFSYILDENEKVKKLINQIGEKFNTPIYTHNPEILEDWLAGFRDAQLVVTDSYHGCVLSIVFNKPFICIINKQRGETRFKSLEDVFHLEGRFINCIDNANWDKILQPININNVLSKLTIESITYIRKSLTEKPKYLNYNFKENIKKIIFLLFPKNTKRRSALKKIYFRFKHK